MKRALIGLVRVSRLFGLDPVTFVRTLRGLPGFVRDIFSYRRSASAERMPIRLPALRPMLGERNAAAGATGHYFHQDLWAARKVVAAKPQRHLDIGSRIDGFVGHLLAHMPVEVIDIRALESPVRGLSFVQEDATDLGTIPTGSIESISTLHAIEHFGLGRYGDQIDASACFRAMRSLARVLAPGGRLYFSVPIGIERVEFNAHRIFAPSTIIHEFGALRLVSFSAVDDHGRFHEDVDPACFEKSWYSCGLFEFTK